MWRHCNVEVDCVIKFSNFILIGIFAWWWIVYACFYLLWPYFFFRKKNLGKNNFVVSTSWKNRFNSLWFLDLELFNKSVQFLVLDCLIDLVYFSSMPVSSEVWTGLRSRFFPCEFTKAFSFLKGFLSFKMSLITFRCSFLLKSAGRNYKKSGSLFCGCWNFALTMVGWWSWDNFVQHYTIYSRYLSGFPRHAERLRQFLQDSLQQKG